jgi:PKD repeat protein
MKNLNRINYILLILLAAGIWISSCKKSPPVIAEFSQSLTEAFIGDSVYFINFSENATFYQWDFGDGNSSIEEDAAHAYDEEGVYEVSLIAIGENDSDTAYAEVEVTNAFDVTIFEGVGIEDVFLFDTWQDVQAGYTSDTIYFRGYNEEDSIYIHWAYFINDGVAFIFINEDTLINFDDPVIFIDIVAPYEGGTTKGIGIGSPMTRVRTVYGEPEDIRQGDAVTEYWYDTQGIDFLTWNSGNVDEIFVYAIATGKSAADQASKLKLDFFARDALEIARKQLREYLE